MLWKQSLKDKDKLGWCAYKTEGIVESLDEVDFLLRRIQLSIKTEDGMILQENIGGLSFHEIKSLLDSKKIYWTEPLCSSNEGHETLLSECENTYRNCNYCDKFKGMPVRDEE